MTGYREYRGWYGLAIGVALAGFAACGGGDGNGGGGGPLSPSGPGPGASGATITIAASGAVSPTQVTIARGQSVTFVNNDSRAHQIASDPHPTHTACPSINALGSIPGGQTRTTNSFEGAGSCGFHDHNEPDNASLKGSITVQ